MTDIVKTNANLPADFGANLMRGLADTRAAIVVADGKPFFRLLRDGTYVFGASNEEVQDGSRWAVNLASMCRGWVCWIDGELQGQVMASVQAPRLPQPAPVNGTAYAEQFGFDIVCLTGTDKGVNAQYKNNSYGFKKAFDQLCSDIAGRYVTDQRYYWPILTFTAESYDHKRYGEIWNPIFTVVAWADAEGNIAGQAKAVIADAPAADAAPVKPVAKRSRKPALAEASPADLDRQASAILKNAGATSLQQAEPAAPVQGQRRRPVAR